MQPGRGLQAAMCRQWAPTPAMEAGPKHAAPASLRALPHPHRAESQKDPLVLLRPPAPAPPASCSFSAIIDPKFGIDRFQLCRESIVRLQLSGPGLRTCSRCDHKTCLTLQSAIDMMTEQGAKRERRRNAAKGLSSVYMLPAAPFKISVNSSQDASSGILKTAASA